MNGKLGFSDRVYAVVVGVLVMALVIALAIVEVIGESRPSPAAAHSPWADDIRAVDEALAAKDLHAARWALGQAYGVALRSRQWDGMLAVGDAAVRAGDLSRARIAYLTAAFRARHARSLAGVLLAAEAFGALGDLEVAQRCLALAREVAGDDPQALAVVGAVTERLSHGSAAEVRPEARP